MLAFQGPAEAFNRWRPTADYLSEKIEGITFEIRAYDLKSLRSAVEDNQIDFVLN